MEEKLLSFLGEKATIYILPVVEIWTEKLYQNGIFQYLDKNIP